jgi:hypothetical protein
MMFGDVTLECNKNKTTLLSLFDSGAGLCYMSFELWRRAGFDEMCFNANPTLMELIGFKSKEDFTFENLPLKKEITMSHNQQKNTCTKEKNHPDFSKTKHIIGT